MSGDGRRLHVTRNWPVIDEVVWVPIVDLPWRPDSKDRKPDQEREAS